MAGGLPDQVWSLEEIVPSYRLGVGGNVPITAIKMANHAKIDPNVFRQALREENFDWHKPNNRWTVKLGSDHLVQVDTYRIVRLFKSRQGQVELDFVACLKFVVNPVFEERGGQLGARPHARQCRAR